MEVVGTVTQSVKCRNRECTYKVTVDGEEITIESKGTQALKDYLFIRVGQKVRLVGTLTGNRIQITKAKIIITKEK